MDHNYYNSFNYTQSIQTNFKQSKDMSQEEFEDDIIEEKYEFANTDTDGFQDMEMINDNIFYPLVPDFDLWESFLNRSLEHGERKILHNYLLENDTNLQIKSLHYNLISNGFYSIPKLTKNNGNCLFESLSYQGYGTTSEIRKNIAALLLLVKNDYNFFPGTNTCPEELFTNCNDIEVVRDKQTDKVYEYDYDAMVVDLYTNHSWSRLPMELILMTISRIYEVHIKIFSNNSKYVNFITSWTINDSSIDIVHLGHINEEHYVPVIKISDEIANEPLLIEEFTKTYPKYISAKHDYHDLGRQMATNIGLYNDTKDNPINKNKSRREANNYQSPDLIIDLDQIKDFNEFEIIE